MGLLLSVKLCTFTTRISLQENRGKVKGKNERNSEKCKKILITGTEKKNLANSTFFTEFSGAEFTFLLLRFITKKGIPEKCTVRLESRGKNCYTIVVFFKLQRQQKQGDL